MKRETNRYHRVTTQLTLAATLGNLTGALIIFAYFDIIQANVAENLSPDTAVPLIATIINIVSLIIFGNVLALLWARPLDNWHRRLAAGSTETPPPQVRTQALNRPVVAAVVSAVMWLMAGIIQGLTSSLRLSPFSFDWDAFTTIFIGVTVIAGSITTAIIYFATERFWRRELVLFFPDGNLSATPSFRVTVRRRLLFLFVIGILPLLALAILSYDWSSSVIQAAQSGATLGGLLKLDVFIVSIGVVLMVTLAITVGASLVEPIDTLAQEMAAVRQGDLERRVVVISNDEMGLLAEGFNAMVDGLRQEEVIRDLFQRYVTPQVADYAIQHGADLGGQTITATILFSDIRGFTALTERMEPATLIALLNRYFEATTTVVLKHGGLVNKFGGDSILAVFGTPLNPSTDHARQAVQAAQEMMDALDEFNRQQEKRGEPTLRIGVGIATGPVVAGNVGSTERLEYTVIGDAVNLASRLQSLTKELNMPILLNELAGEATEDKVPMGRISVRGKQEPVRIYGLMHSF